MRRPLLLVTVTAALLASTAAADALAGHSASDLVNEGNELFAKGDYESALKKYLEAQTLKPNSPELHFNIGDVEYGKGKFDNAASEFRRVLQSGDKRILPELAYNMATSAVKQKQVDRAIDLYKAAIKLDPKDIEARHNLGVLLAEKQKQEQKQDQKDQKDQKDDQDKKDDKQQGGGGQKDDKQKQDQKDKKDQQKQDQQGKGDDKDKQKQDEQKSAEQKKDEQKKDEKQAQEKKDDKDKDKEKKQGAAGKEQKPQNGQEGGQAAEIAGAIPRDQAERLLDLLKEEEKQGVFAGQPKRGDEQEPEKDW